MNFRLREEKKEKRKKEALCNMLKEESDIRVKIAYETPFSQKISLQYYFSELLA